jgi:fatty-acyl-CoA synthase
MLQVDDTHFTRQDFERLQSIFDRHPIVSRCDSHALAVRVADPAFLIALCLYVKQRGGSVFPLPVDMPLKAARRRAERSGCGYLVFGQNGEEALGAIETTRGDVRGGRGGLVQTSSGTTGEPKYILRSWSSIDAEIESYRLQFEAARSMTPIVACPVNHSYGLISGVLVALARGQEPRIVSNPNPKYILRKLRETSEPLLYSSPTLIATITMLATDEQPIHAIMTSGTSLQKAWFELARRRCRHLHQQYGCSEAGCISLGQDIATPNDLGLPLAHVDVRAGKSSAEPGEIQVRVSADPLIDTRDLGYFEEGRLHFVSRLDDMINVSGFNVYPTEVEEAVLAMAGVSDAVVYKRKRDFGSEQVCLDFVSSRDLSSEQIREWCSKMLAPHQVPMSIQRVQAIPRAPNGKVSRKALGTDTPSLS